MACKNKCSQAQTRTQLLLVGCPPLLEQRWECQQPGQGEQVQQKIETVMPVRARHVACQPCKGLQQRPKVL